MTVDEIMEKVRRSIKETVPNEITINSIEFEGSVVVIYTTNVDVFAKNNKLVRSLAHKVRRRIEIRPDPSILVDIERAKRIIKKTVPEEADIKDIWFNSDNGEVVIEAMLPGLAIGKHGFVLNRLKNKIGWSPKVVRSPPIHSKTVDNIRQYLRQKQDERRAFLQKVGRRINRQEIEGTNWVRTTFLGGYREVGRSCTLLSTRESRVLVDCGINVSAPAGSPESSPYLYLPDLLPLSNLDAVIVTHAHLDHQGLVPALFLYGYDGPVYCTTPTRDMMSLLQIDYLKVVTAEGRKPPYGSEQIREAVKHTICVDYEDTIDISPDIKLTFREAGHIIGSSICHFHIRNGLYNIALSGDMKYEKTWLFNPAETKFPRLEAFIMESTYGGKNDMQPSREGAVEIMKDVVLRTIEKGGKVLIPVFAVGRSQEVMLVLEDMMRKGEVPKMPIYLDGMIWEATAIHTAYPEYLNNQLRDEIFNKDHNPFISDIFNKVDSMEARADLCSSEEPCIVLATSGMLNGGPVMEYLKSWASEEENTLLFVGYQAEGTTGRKIQRGFKEIMLYERNKPVKVNVALNIENCEGFSGHSDRKQLMNYVARLRPKPEMILLGHGEESKCLELARDINKKHNIETRVPKNLEAIRYR